MKRLSLFLFFSLLALPACNAGGLSRQYVANHCSLLISAQWGHIISTRSSMILALAAVRDALKDLKNLKPANAGKKKAILAQIDRYSVVASTWCLAVMDARRGLRDAGRAVGYLAIADSSKRQTWFKMIEPLRAWKPSLCRKISYRKPWLTNAPELFRRIKKMEKTHKLQESAIVKFSASWSASK